MSGLAFQWAGAVWLAVLILAPALIIALIDGCERRAERQEDVAYRSRALQQFGEWIAVAPGDGSIDDTLTLHWCPLCRTCSWGSQHWVRCGAWRDQDAVLTVTAHEVTRYEVTP